jgi:hypothetical protein
VIIGQDNANVPNVIKLFADAFAKSSIEIDSLVGQRMILILKHVQVRNSSFKICILSLFYLDNSINISNMYEYFN